MQTGLVDKFGSGPELRLGNMIEIAHSPQNIVAAFSGALGIGNRIIGGRELRKAGQHGYLGEVQLFELLAIVKGRRGRDTVSPVAEEDLVEI